MIDGKLIYTYEGKITKIEGSKAFVDVTDTRSYASGGWIDYALLSKLGFVEGDNIIIEVISYEDVIGLRFNKKEG